MADQEAELNHGNLDTLNNDYGRHLYNYAIKTAGQDNFYSLTFGTLHRLNIANLHNKLAWIKSRLHHEKNASEQMREELQKLLKDYATAIRDYNYLIQIRALDVNEATEFRQRLTQAFRYIQTPDCFDPFDTGYRGIPDSTGDGFRTFLELQLARAYERVGLWAGQHNPDFANLPAQRSVPKALPHGIAKLADNIARLTIAFAGGAFVVVPMVVMSLDRSTAKSLVTASVSVVLFALFIAFVVRIGDKTTLAAVTAYASVLAVFVGESLPSI